MEPDWALLATNGSILEFARDDLKRNKLAVLAAVTDCGRVLEFASDELRGDKEVVLAAFDNFPAAFKFASRELQEDTDFVLELLDRPGGYQALPYASEQVRIHIEHTYLNCE